MAQENKVISLIDYESKKPISFANIVYPDTGLISGPDGMFLPLEHMNEEFLIYANGYYTLIADCSVSQLDTIFMFSITKIQSGNSTSYVHNRILSKRRNKINYNDIKYIYIRKKADTLKLKIK